MGGPCRSYLSVLSLIPHRESSIRRFDVGKRFVVVQDPFVFPFTTIVVGRDSVGC